MTAFPTGYVCIAGLAKFSSSLSVRINEVHAGSTCNAHKVELLLTLICRSVRTLMSLIFTANGFNVFNTKEYSVEVKCDYIGNIKIG